MRIGGPAAGMKMDAIRTLEMKINCHRPLQQPPSHPAPIWLNA
jgi:hypothetical protein